MDVYRVLHSVRQHKNITNLVMFIAVFLVGLMTVFSLGIVVLQNSLRDDVATHVAAFDEANIRLVGAFDILESEQRGAVCSQTFLDWLREVAFLPDGIHEFMYSKDGSIQCTAARGVLPSPVALGEPDARSNRADIDIWFNRNLGMIGFPSLNGTLVRKGDFVVVAPEPTIAHEIPAWQNHEVVFVSADNSIWHRSGTPGHYESLVLAPEANQGSVLSERGCDRARLTCIVVSTPTSWIFSPRNPLFYFAFGAVAIIAAGAVFGVNLILSRQWSLPVRFHRRLSQNTVTCHYQPMLSVKTDTIDAVEVLARWSDVDGSLMYPDRFLPIVESRQLHLEFTRHLVNKAYAELSQLPPDSRPLRVHFNIFPCIFNAELMLDLFEEFLSDKNRFTVVIELVESDALPMDATHTTIQHLEAEGIQIYIDDFGEGYSSIQYLAGLGTHGVKLDRSFGLAPEGSLMDVMLASAIEMVGKTGQTLVVEGVETPNRLASLKAAKSVSLAQGYYISRPLPFSELVAFLDKYSNQQAAA